MHKSLHCQEGGSPGVRLPTRNWTGPSYWAQAVLVLAELDRQIDLLPPIQNCARQAVAIRGLVD